MNIKTIFKKIWSFIKNFYDCIVIVFGILALFGFTSTAIISFFYDNNFIFLSLMIFILLAVYIAYYIKFKMAKKEIKKLISLQENNRCLKKEIEEYQNCFKLESIKTMMRIGIIDCTLKLNNTEFTPRNCMESIRKKLLFSGVSGAKWVQDPANETKFKKMLDKISNNNGEVKFLLINPKSQAFTTMSNQREGDISSNSYPIWQKLVREYSCLEVRCYDHLPSFRIQLMDDNVAAISRYLIRKVDYEKFNQGWDIPHLIIKADCELSFYPIFEKEFLKEWNNAINILDIDLEGGI